MSGSIKSAEFRVLALFSMRQAVGRFNLSRKMTLSDAPEALKRFRKTTWKFQQTFKTPLKDLPSFVTTVLSGCHELHGASITIDAVVFEPKHLIGLLSSHSLALRYGKGVRLTTNDAREVSPLLEAALGDWIDFVFSPQPKLFVIYADHDEYTTFYAHSRSNLNRVTDALKQRGFTSVEGYRRRF
jgi:hypothetical protein